MHVLATHRERVAELRKALERLFDIHSRVYHLRAQSWQEQSQGEVGRAELLDTIDEDIRVAELDAAEARAVLVIPPREAEN